MERREKPITRWAALFWGLAIDVVLCVMGAMGGPVTPFFHMPVTFMIILILVPVVILFLVSICNSPTYKRPQ